MKAPRFSFRIRPGQTVAAAYAEAFADRPEAAAYGMPLKARKASRRADLMLVAMCFILGIAFAYVLLLHEAQAAPRAPYADEHPTPALVLPYGWHESDTAAD